MLKPRGSVREVPSRIWSEQVISPRPKFSVYSVPREISKPVPPNKQGQVPTVPSEDGGSEEMLRRLGWASAGPGSTGVKIPLTACFLYAKAGNLLSPNLLQP